MTAATPLDVEADDEVTDDPAPRRVRLGTDGADRRARLIASGAIVPIDQRVDRAGEGQPYFALGTVPPVLERQQFDRPQRDHRSMSDVIWTSRK